MGHSQDAWEARRAPEWLCGGMSPYTESWDTKGRCQFWGRKAVDSKIHPVKLTMAAPGKWQEYRSHVQGLAVSLTSRDLEIPGLLQLGISGTGDVSLCQEPQCFLVSTELPKGKGAAPSCRAPAAIASPVANRSCFRSCTQRMELFDIWVRCPGFISGR